MFIHGSCFDVRPNYGGNKAYTVINLAKRLGGFITRSHEKGYAWLWEAELPDNLSEAKRKILKSLLGRHPDIPGRERYIPSARRTERWS